MDLLQLNYFCDAAEQENFSRTAEKFNVPPSNISQTVKRLEDELGVKLFHRTANRIKLSEEGRVFYEGARRALSTLSEAKERARATGGEVCGELRLQILTNRRIVTLAIERFKRSYPGVQISINHDTSAPHSEFDLIISDSLTHTASCSFEPLLTERIMLAVRRGSRFDGRRSVTLSDLRDERFVSMSPTSRLSELVGIICRSVGFTPNVIISTDDPYYVRKYVELGLGVAIVPSHSWRGLFSDDIVLIDIGDYNRTTGLFTHTDRPPSTAARAFSEILRLTFCEEAEGSSDSW